ncbi:MAG: glutamine-hydrolyzing carbamoyl-phosphate synthase small subunit [Oscillospiraceae bacterium]|nr:glutamine-hydrolyzing carbamoyl-phosphate synthase small subunit [Oscillospiraceae bacterium]
MIREFDRKLILEDGTEMMGYSFGAQCDTVCEIVFNTSMVGYQEILSDPSYTYQAVVMTYPLIGNYGMAEDDYETVTPTIGAMIVGEINDAPSNFRSTFTLSSVMQRYGIPGISGVDTRKLARHIRNYGMCKVLICNADTSLEKGLAKLQKIEIPKDAVSKVTAKGIFTKEVPDAQFHVVAIDCGMKENIVRNLNQRGCSVTVVPYDTSADAIVRLQPDGIFLSNGPGDPTDVPMLIHTVEQLHGKYPMFGICLGHQIISLSYGAKCYKLKFGHRGGNHPVKNLANGKIEITSQNHSYAVESESIQNTPLTVTHINLLDHTVEGVENQKDHVFSVQYHPESAPGPEDSTYLFDKFIQMMEAYQNAEKNRY